MDNLARFRLFIPSIHTRSPSNPSRSRHGFPCAADPILVEVFIMAASATLLFQSVMVPQSAQAYTECLSAAHAVADMVIELDQPSIIYLNATSIVVRAIFIFRIQHSLSLKSVDFGNVASLAYFHRSSCEGGHPNPNFWFRQPGAGSRLHSKESSANCRFYGQCESV